MWAIATGGGEPARCEGYIALTFDDGPNPQSTLELLDILNRHNARATFFNVGRQEHKHPELVQAAKARGHWFGNHTYAHRDLTKLSRAQIIEDLRRAEAGHRSITGSEPRLFRPPYGYTDEDVQAAARALGLVEVLWTTDSVDWDPDRSVEQIVDGATNVDSGGIVEMHDLGQKQTVQALPTILRELREQRLCPGRIARSETPQTSGPGIDPARDIYVRSVEP